MKKIAWVYLLVACINNSFGQTTNIDSLTHALGSTQNDTERLVLLTNLSSHYFIAQNDSAIAYAKQEYELAHRLGFKIDEAYSLDILGFSMFFQDDPHSLESFYKGLAIAEDPAIESITLPPKYLNRIEYADSYINFYGDRRTPHIMRMEVLANLNFDLGNTYGFNMEKVEKQWDFYQKAKAIYVDIRDTLALGMITSLIARTHYAFINQFDSAVFYAMQAYELLKPTGKKRWIGSVTDDIAHIYYEKGNNDSAVKYYKITYQLFKEGNFPDMPIYLDVLSFFLPRESADFNLQYAREIFEKVNKSKSAFFLPEASTLLAKAYKGAHQNDSAYKYFEYALALMDSSSHQKTKMQFLYQDESQQKREQEIESARVELKNTVRTYSLIAGLAVALLIAGILMRNNRQRKKANEQLQDQKKEIESTLSELRLTQAQLIQSEKMASLGELTAGIAHEIQNPLNFVNNFSDVNAELIGEMETEMENGNLDDARSIARDIRENELKINQHGKRADSIVKSMLQHSRVSSGLKEPTNINTLTDEYFRLAYQGQRAKDRSFNVKMESEFAENVGEVNIVSQDIGRVLLNLFNNAFYAVAEKKKLQPEGYEPAVSVRTKKSGANIEIRVKDNGNGIPHKTLEKIFQPFFTTKPAGHGTGLGLSLSYDIVKAHGGELKVESHEGTGTEFIIQIPA